jgi:hypothetical protein
VLYFVGLIAGPLWFPIVLGLYGIGVLATPKNPKHEMHMRNEFQVVDIRAELDNLLRRINNRVPKEIYEKVASIRASIIEVLPQIIDLSAADYNIYVIQQTAIDYLPVALENFINLPKAYANFHIIKDNKTARQLLLEQLTLMDTEMKAVVQDIYKADTDQLVIHGRFLQDKFGKPLLEEGKQQIPLQTGTATQARQPVEIPQAANRTPSERPPLRQQPPKI